MIFLLYQYTFIHECVQEIYVHGCIHTCVQIYDPVNVLFFFISILILILIRKEHFYSIFFFVDRMNSVLNSRRMHNSLKPRFNVLKKLALLLLFFRN